MPVKAHAYRTIAELNGGFEKVIQELETLWANQLLPFWQRDRHTRPDLPPSSAGQL